MKRGKMRFLSLILAVFLTAGFITPAFAYADELPDSQQNISGDGETKQNDEKPKEAPPEPPSDDAPEQTPEAPEDTAPGDTSDGAQQDEGEEKDAGPGASPEPDEPSLPSGESELEEPQYLGVLDLLPGEVILNEAGLQQAIAAAQTGAEIYIGRDITLQSSITIAEDKEITFIGTDESGSEPQSRIISVPSRCSFIISGTAELTFQGVRIDGNIEFSAQAGSTLHITGLEVSGSATPLYALAGSTVTLESCQWHDNNLSGGTRGVINAANADVSIINSVFKDNMATAININNGTLEIKNCVFEKNAAATNGGVIGAQSCRIEIADSKFTENSAGSGLGINGSVTAYGGAIYAVLSNIEIERTGLSGNKADGPNKATTSGGAIYALGTYLHLKSDTEILNNTAPGTAGLYASTASGTRSQVDIAGSSEAPVVIAGNQGLGMLAYGCEVQMRFARIEDNVNGTTGSGGGIQFSNAKATIVESVISGNSGGYGGGIYSTNSELRLETTQISGNKAYIDGAGIYLGNSTATITGTSALNDNVPAESSSALRGGAVFVGSESELVIDNTQVKDNRAASGGAIYCYSSPGSGDSSVAVGEETQFINNGATGDGGAIYAQTARVGLDISGNDNTLFQENKAGNYGGAVYAYQASGNINGAVFEKNDAQSYGGAVFVWNIGDKVSIKNAKFEKNTTALNGAAIYSSSCEAEIQDVQMIGNEAASQGGGIYAYLGSVAINESEILGNKSGGSGGGVFLHTANAGFGNTPIQHNESGGSGGGIYAYNAALQYRGNGTADCAVAGNTARNYGGGIYIEGALNGGVSSLDDIWVEGNGAFNGGGIAVRGAARVTGSRQTFKDNTAENNGGAISVSRSALETGALQLHGVTFGGNSARRPVNILSQYDYDLYSELVESGALTDVNGHSLGSGFTDPVTGNTYSIPDTFGYLGNDGTLYELDIPEYKVYNNYDIAYHELIYSVVYKPHNSAEAADIADQNFYGSGIRATNAGAQTLTVVKITDNIPQYEYTIDNTDVLDDDLNASMTFAGWAHSLEKPLLTQNAAGAYMIDLNEMVDHTIYLHARYKPTVLTVSFDANSGEFSPSAESMGAGTFPTAGDYTVLDVSVNYGGDIDEPSAYVSKDDAYFAGWYTESDGGSLVNLSEVKESQTVYAHWVPIKAGEFIVIYYMDETEQETYFSQAFDAPGQLPSDHADSFAVPSLPGYTMSSWYSEKYGDDLFDTTFAAGEVVKLYPKWEVGKYEVKIKNSEKSKESMTVRLERNGTSESWVLEDNQAKEFNDITIEDKIYLLRDSDKGIYFADYVPMIAGGAVFVEYEPLEDGSGFIVQNIASRVAVSITNDIRRYTVRFYEDENALGADGHIAAVTVQHGDTLDDTLTTEQKERLNLQKTGYELTGWAGQAAASFAPAFDADFLDIPVTGNMNYYAVWKAVDPDLPGGDGDDGDGGGGSGGGSGGGNGNNTDDKDKEEDAQDGGPGGTMLERENHFAYIVGYPNGQVRPDAHISREEAATIFFRLLTQESRAELWSKRNSFSDIESGRWSNNAVSTMANGDILKGYPDGTFRPEAGITRAEVASIAVRFEESQDISAQTQFTDTAGHWAEREIALAAELGYVNGYADGTFRPDAQITRAEVVVMLNRVLGRQLSSAQDLLPDMQIWTDNMDASAWFYLDIQEATHSQYYEMKADGMHKRWTALRESPDWTLLEKADATADVISW